MHPVDSLLSRTLYASEAITVSAVTEVGLTVDRAVHCRLVRLLRLLHVLRWLLQLALLLCQPLRLPLLPAPLARHLL